MKNNVFANLVLTDVFASKFKQVSVVSDTYGFDLESYDLDDNGKIQKIFIEVKTTSSKIDTEFYVSKNEVKKSQRVKRVFLDLSCV
jgi:hypothetical protein